MMTEVAKTILAQLGGGRFVAMTGARKMSGDEDTLLIHLPARFAKDGITAVKIKLEANDTYTMTFYKVTKARGQWTGGTTYLTIAEVEDVYNDSLRSVFESKTGLATSLGTMKVLG